VRRRTALLATGALFLMGILVGVLATHAFYAWQIHRPGGLAGLGLRLLGGSLERELDLTEEQEREVDAILADTRLEMQAVRHDMVPRLFAIRTRAFERISRLLTPEQQEDLKRFRARHESNVNRLVGDW
jgi:Spy/CpxP family protein refolding chaperone